MNDISKDLMDFYECVKNPLFLDELILINNIWEEIKILSDNVVDVFGETFFELIIKKEKNDIFSNKIFINFLNFFIKRSTYIQKYDFFWRFFS